MFTCNSNRCNTRYKRKLNYKATFSAWRHSVSGVHRDSCVAVEVRGVNALRDPYVTGAPWLGELLVVLAGEGRECGKGRNS